MSCVREVDPRQDARWDRFVRSRPDASVYHLAAWAAILSSAYRFRPRYLFAEDGDMVTGVLPLMEKRGPLSGRRMRSLPVVQTAGPLALRSDVAAALVEHALRLADAGGAQLVLNARLGGLEQLVPALVRQPTKPSWVLDVPALDELAAWERERPSNLRRSIAKARKARLTIRDTAARDDIRTFHRLYLQTMRKHRSLPRTLRQFEAARRLLPEGVLALFLAEDGDGVLAGGMFHVFNGTAELIYNGSDERRLDARPNHALYRGVVEWAAERGLRHIDLGGAWPDSSLAGFKRQWGAVEVPEHYYVPSHAAGPVDVGTALSEGPARRLRERIDGLWGTAPLPLTEAAGKLAYRWL